MTQEEILEGNKLIAEFMGFTNVEVFNNSLLLSHPEEGIWYYEPLWYLDYHKDWSILMPVVEKIRDMKNESAEYMTQNSKVASALTTVRIWIVYKAVIEFIKWHNTQTK